MATKNNKNRPSNYFIATFRCFSADGVKLTASGQPIAKARVSLSMGKDKDGEYKPSMWFDIIGYTPKGDEPNDVTKAVGDLEQGDYVTVKGRLALDEWTGDDGVVRQNHSIWVKDIEPFSFDDDEEDDDEDEEDLI